MSVKRYTIYYNERERDMYVAESQDGKYCLHSDYAALLARHNALKEAVAWERECQAFTYRNPLSIDAMKELLRTRYAARAEVDRLIANEGAADCEGEG